MLSIFYGLVVSGTSRLYDIVMIFGVSFKGNIGIAISAFKIKSKDFDSKIDLIITDFHSHVELGADVEIIGACIAS